MRFTVDPIGRSQLGHIRILPADSDEKIYNFAGRWPGPVDTQDWTEYAETTARRIAEDFATQVVEAPGWTGRCSREELMEELRKAWMKLQEERVLDLSKFL